MADHKLDIFDVLKKLDKKNLDWYSGLLDDEKKSVAPLILMRWMSACQDQDQMHSLLVLLVNDFVNRDFWVLSKHPELQTKLLALCGPGKPQRHQWIKGPTRKGAGSKTKEFLTSVFGSMNDQETDIMMDIGKEELKDLLDRTGTPDKEQAVILKEFKALKNV